MGGPVIAGAAVIQALTTLAIVGLTVVYVIATRRISTASDRVADANERVLSEIQIDREIARRQPSAKAARRLQRALTGAEQRWMSARFSEAPGTDGPSFDDGLRQALQEWQTACANDAAVLLSEALREDVKRFTKVLSVAAFNWDTVLLLVEEKEGAFRAEQRRNTDNRVYRLSQCRTRLSDALGAYRRSEDPLTPRLPDDAWAYWLTRPGDEERLLDGNEGSTK